MDEAEYILRLVLRARDEMAAVLQKARTQIRGFAKDADDMNVSVTNLNKALDNFDKNMGSVTKKLQEWRATIRGINDDGKSLKKTFDDVGKSADRTAKATRDLNLTQEQLQKRARAVRDEMRGIGKEHEAGFISTELAIAKYKKLGRELEELTLKMSRASRTKSPAHIWADEAEAASERLKRISRENVEDAKRRAADEKKILDDINKAVDDHVKKRAAAEKATTEINRAEQAERMRIANAEIDALVRQRTEQERIAKQAEADAARAVERRKQFIRDESRYRIEAAEITKRIERDSKGFGREVDPRDLAELRALAEGHRRLSRDTSASREEMRQHGAEADRLNAIIRRNTRDTDRLGGSTSKLGRIFGGGRASAAGFDNQLRGLGILAAVVSIEQLIGAVVALGGELVSLAGSAAMAGGALGGILAAGAAQALPVIGLLVGAFSRVKGVMDAFGKAQDLQKAQFTDAEKGGQKAIDQANTLANAHDAVADANDRLAESRKALTQAQKDGTEQLEDLIYAEKSAALAARGASLNVKEAQKALADAIRSGASALEIEGRQQALDEAKLGAGRSRTVARRATAERKSAGGDIGNLESVQSAAKAVEDAEKAVTKANRGLDQAADKADRAASSTMTAAANLNYLLSQMSPAERKLFESVKRIYDNYKRIFVGTNKKDGIYGVITDSFTRAVDEADRIMQMPKVIKAVQGLANEIGTNIDKIVDAVDADTIDQLLTIMGQAGDNMGPLVDIVIDLAKAFLDIAEAANPAFEKLIEYIEKVVGKFTGLTDDSSKLEDFFTQGEEHLESWLDLIGAIIGLFAALTGASAESGKTSIDDLTEKIESWTEYIKDNKEDVVAFFEDARDAAYAVGGVLEKLAVTLFGVFDRERVEKFADFLNNVVIPALEDVIDTIGYLSDKFVTLMENDAIAGFAKFALSLFLLGKIAGPIATLLRPIAVALLSIGKFVWRCIVYFDDLLKILGRARGVFVGALTGPVAIIALVVTGVILLLDYFGKLDDIWRAIKETAAEFWKDIKPAIEDLKTAFEKLGGNMDWLKDIFVEVKRVGKALAEFITIYLIDSIKGIGKILAGVALIIIRWVTFIVEIIGGIVKVIQGIIDVFQGEGSDKLKEGLRDIGNAIKDFALGILEAIGKILEGLVKIFLAPFKAAWGAIKDFFGISSPSKKFKSLGRSIVEGLKDGLKGIANFLTGPFRLAWTKLNEWFDGKPQKIAENIVDGLVDHFRTLWRRFRAAASYVWEKFKSGWDGAKKFGTTIVNTIVDGIKALPGALIEAVKTIGGQLLEVGSAIGNAIWDGIKAVFGGVGDIAKGMIGKISSFFGGGDDEDDKKKPAQAKPQQAAPKVDIGQAAVPFGAKDLETAQKMYEAFWKGMRSTADASTGFIQRQFREMRIASTGSMEALYKAVRGSIGDIQKSFDVRGDAIVKGWAKDYLSLMKVSHDGLTYIAHETNKALKAMGEKTITYGLEAPKKSSDGKAVGGWIGNRGERGKDAGFYPLGRGEAVLNYAHQPYVETALNATYGFGLGGLFNHVRGYHAGGPEQPGFAAGHAGVGAGKWVANEQLARVVKSLMRRYKFQITAAGEGGHSTNSDHHWGGALDLVPGAGGTWEDLDKLAKASGWRPNAPMPKTGPFRWIGWNTESGHGQPPRPNAHLHLSWKREGPWTGPGGSGGGGVAAAVEEIKSKVITPRTTATARLVQAAFDRVVGYANKKVASTAAASSAETSGAGFKVSGKGNEANMRLGKKMAADIYGWVGAQWDALKTLWQHESGWNAAIPNQAGSGAYGIPQALPASKMANKSQGGGPDWRTNPATQISWGLRYIKDRYKNPVGAWNFWQHPVNSPPGASKNWYAQGGHIDGPEGSPIPIVAHAGEWVLNKGQQMRAAMLAGLSPSNLKAMLGFGGGPTHFQKGGEVLLVGDSLAVGIEQAIKKAFKGAKASVEEGISSAAAVERLKNNYKKAFKSVIFDAGTNDEQAKVFGRNLKRAYKLLHEDQELIVPTLKGGKQAAEKNKLLRKFAAAHKNVDVVDTTDIALGADKLHPTAAGYSRIASRIGAAVRSPGAGTGTGEKYEVAPIQTMKTLLADVSDTWKGLKAISGVMKKMKGNQGATGKAYEEITGLLDNVIGAGGIAGIVQEISERVARAATRLKQDTFKLVDGVVTRGLKPDGVLARELGSAIRLTDDLFAEKGVVTESMKKVNSTIKKVTGDKSLSEKQRKKLLQSLEGQRNALLIEQDRIDSEIADALEARFNKQIEVQQDAVDQIKKAGETERGGLDLQKRIASVLGQDGIVSNLNQKIANSLSAEADRLQGRIAAARAAGATDLADQLEKEVQDLRVQVFEAGQAAAREAVDAITKRASRRMARLDLFERMANALGRVGDTTGVQVGGETLSRSGVFAQRGQALEAQRGGYAIELEKAMRGSINPLTGALEFNQGLIDELNDSITELDVTIAENTAAEFASRVASVTEASDYLLSINDLKKGLQESKDALSGVTDSTELLRLANERDGILRQRQTDLQKLYDEAVADGNVKASQELYAALLSNEIAINQNTRAIKDATGAGSSPQTFSSTVWGWIGRAFFGGTGKVLPQYDLPGASSMPFTTGTGDVGINSSTSNSTGDTNIYVEVNEAGQPIDPTRVASTIGFAQATAP